MDLQLNENERLDNLGEGYYIIQNTETFLFGIDSVLLADFASRYVKPKSVVGEVGTGAGIIPLLLAKRARFKVLRAFEIQKPMVELATRNIKLNNLDNITVEERDVRNYRDLKQNSFDVLISNPPYFPNIKSTSLKIETQSPNEAVRIARSEVTLTLEELLRFAGWTLKERGRFLLCYRPDRLGELIVLAHKYSLTPKIFRFVYSNLNKDATLVLIELSKRGNPGLKVKKPLVIYKDGEYTPEIHEIYEGISRIGEIKKAE